MSKRQQNNLSFPAFTAEDILYPTVETYSGGFRQSFGDRSNLMNQQGNGIVPNAGEAARTRSCKCPCCIEVTLPGGTSELRCCGR